MCKKQSINIGYFKEEYAAVIYAVMALKKDICNVTDCQVNLVLLGDDDSLKKNAGNCEILIATKDIYEWLDDEKTLEKWEGYVVKKHNGTVYICGADRRGTIFGIYELSKYIGVSPWYYFADVPVRKKEFMIPDDFYAADYPSVPYRGIFLNDEEELEEWAAIHTKDGTIGPELYRKIYELILRLKGNYIWPAMHVNYFQENPENARLASEMGIIVGTSHCDMLMRSNQNEWNPWLREKGYVSDYNAVHSNKLAADGAAEENKEDIYYDYSIPGKNRDVIQQYWRESIQMNKDYEVCYTIGMRGVHDYGFSTKAIDDDKTATDQEKEEARVRLLEKIMKDQRDMLREELGLNSPGEALQSFIPYKEVLDLYDKGLQVPDDVTLIWVNDNFGHVRRYPNAAERERSGGHGLYYHVSYWAAPDMSYLFFNSIPLAQMTSELNKAYHEGIRKMWVLNVGALKPLEMEMETFLDYAWEAGRDAQVTKDIHAYTAAWFDRYFSGGYGEELAALYEEFAQLTNARKIEHMDSLLFAQSGYGDEAGERVCRLESIFERANAIYDQLPDCEREAFFQLFLFKVHASYYVNHGFYYADRSILSYEKGNDRAADCYTEYSHTMMQYLRNMLGYYNRYMCGGKWDRILTPDSFPPPGICFYPACKPSIRRKKGGLKITLWDGSESLDGGCITFSQGGVDKKWIELGNQGCEDISYEISGVPDWLRISETSGVITTEKRIYVTAADRETYAGLSAVLNILDQNHNQTLKVDVYVEERLPVAKGCERTDHGVLESDGGVCLYADNYNAIVKESGGGEWLQIRGIGRGYGNVMMAYDRGNVVSDFEDTSEIMKNPCLEYSFTLKSEGEFELVITRFLTLNSRGRIRFAIGIDRKEPVVVESQATDEWRGGWKESVLNNGEDISLLLPWLSQGEHTLQLYRIDNYVSIHKLVIYTEKRRKTYFGFSDVHNPFDEPKVSWEALDALQKEMYMAEDNHILPEVVYADKEFWKYNRIYMKNDRVQKNALGSRTYEAYYSENQITDITRLFGAGMFHEKNGQLALEAEYALENSEDAYLTPVKTGRIYWTHVRAETDGGTGLAMQVFERGTAWEHAAEAPGMHYRIHISDEGNYHIWLLMLYENHMSDTCYFAVDGKVQPLSAQFRDGQLYNYSTALIYFWCLTGDITFEEGEHIFSIFAGDPRMQIDRIYLSKGEENPPVDAEWKGSERGNSRSKLT